MNITIDSQVGQVVARDFRTASVFKKNGIDFCCKGGRSIAEVCEQKSISPEVILRELQSVKTTNDLDQIDYQAWDLDLMMDYIEKKHHRFVRQRIPEIKSFTHKISRVHGRNHPELHEIDRLFTEAADNLLSHMMKEESILFPMIRNLLSGQSTNHNTRNLQEPIRVMHAEHDAEGQRFRKIAELSNDYTPPEDACTTYRVAFAMLQEFENDLHTHIHLENNILFPRASELENLNVYA